MTILPMRPIDDREQGILTRMTVILAKQIDSANWPTIQNVARAQAEAEWDEAHTQDSWEGKKP